MNENHDGCNFHFEKWASRNKRKGSPPFCNFTRLILPFCAVVKGQIERNKCVKGLEAIVNGYYSNHEKLNCFTPYSQKYLNWI